MNTMSPEDLAEFVSQPTPRSVPKNLLNAQGAITRIVMMVLGSIFMAVGLILSYIFVPPRALEAMQMGFGEVVQTTGSVNTSKETMFSSGGSSRGSSARRRGKPVYRHEFSFDVPEGGSYTGHSFTTARTMRPGSRVEIEYLKNDPATARIVDTRLNPLGLLPAFVLIFPTIGFALLGFSWRSRRRRMRLLRDGSFAFARVTKIQDTKLSINNQRVFEITTTVDTEEPPVEVTTSARGEDVDLARQRMLQKEPLGILYDPSRPKQALLTANLLGKR